MKYNLDIINEYIDKGLVVKQDHPTLPLSIYNYSRTCQYEKLWDEITLNCRGLILDNKGNVIAKPFPKFFNLEEHKPEEIPNEPFEVFEKMDGSLGIIFYYNGEWHLASKGSFTSEQAIKGRKLLDNYNYVLGLYPDYTYLVEIIYPENRIVVDYGNEEKLVVLGAYHTETGEEVSIDEMRNEGFEIVPRYDGIDDFNELKEIINPEAEGFVIRFKSGMRMKIKGEEYIRLHRIITNISTKDIWMVLRSGDPIEPLLERVPDEFDRWIKNTVLQLIAEYIVIEDTTKIAFKEYKSKYETKKDFALVASHDIYSSILFAMWDRKPYDKIIWNLIKPKYEKPFWNKEE